MSAPGADPLAAIRQRAEVLNDAVSFMGDEVDDSERLAVADRAEQKAQSHERRNAPSIR